MQFCFWSPTQTGPPQLPTTRTDRQKQPEAQDKHPRAAAQTARPTHQPLRNKGGADPSLTHAHTSHTDTDTRRLSAPAEPAAPPGAYAPTRTTRAWNSWR